MPVDCTTNPINWKSIGNCHKILNPKKFTWPFLPSLCNFLLLRRSGGERNSSSVAYSTWSWEQPCRKFGRSKSTLHENTAPVFWVPGWPRCSARGAPTINLKIAQLKSKKFIMVKARATFLTLAYRWESVALWQIQKRSCVVRLEKRDWWHRRWRRPRNEWNKGKQIQKIWNYESTGNGAIDKTWCHSPLLPITAQKREECILKETMANESKSVAIFTNKKVKKSAFEITIRNKPTNAIIEQKISTESSNVCLELTNNNEFCRMGSGERANSTPSS